jgi:succinyl-diaminopimelate desuccinylase
MKSGIAAMIVAIERFIQTHPKHKGSVALLVTSDEEGESIDGVVKVIEKLESRKEKIDWCLVGEPSSQKTIGDTIKIGRRGSLHGKLTLHGVQGHIAYPDKAANPIHLFAGPLSKLSAEVWDKGNEHFPPTTFQISNVHSGTGATNVIPGQLEARFNFRFSTESTPEQLKSRVHALLDQCKVKYDLEWTLSGIPFLTREGALLKAVCQAIKKETNIDTELSTIGGTSDGRFVAPTGAEVIEFGLLNATIHKIDECVKISDLEVLTSIYGHILELLLAR